MRQFVCLCAFAVVAAAGSAAEAGWYNCMFGGPFLGDCCYDGYCYQGECGGGDPRCYDNCFRCCPDPNYLVRPEIPRPTGYWTKAGVTCCTATATSCCDNTPSNGCADGGLGCCAPVTH